MKFFKKTKLIATLSAVALLGGVTYAVTGCGEPTEEPKQTVAVTFDVLSYVHIAVKDYETLPTEVEVGTTLELTITVDNGYEIDNVRANGTRVSGRNGVYSVTINEATTITVNATELVTSVAVTTKPTKLTYFAGESVDVTGMVVEVTYGTGRKATVNYGGDDGYSISPSTFAGGETSFRVVYGGQTATVELDKVVEYTATIDLNGGTVTDEYLEYISALNLNNYKYEEGVISFSYYNNLVNAVRLPTADEMSRLDCTFRGFTGFEGESITNTSGVVSARANWEFILVALTSAEIVEGKDTDGNTIPLLVVNGTFRAAEEIELLLYEGNDQVSFVEEETFKGKRGDPFRLEFDLSKLNTEDRTYLGKWMDIRLTATIEGEEVNQEIHVDDTGFKVDTTQKIEVDDCVYNFAVYEGTLKVYYTLSYFDYTIALEDGKVTDDEGTETTATFLVIKGDAVAEFWGKYIHVTWYVDVEGYGAGSEISAEDGTFELKINLTAMPERTNAFAHVTVYEDETMADIVYGSTNTNFLHADSLTTIPALGEEYKGKAGNDISHAIAYEGADGYTYFVGYAWEGLMAYRVNLNVSYTADLVYLTMADGVVYYNIDMTYKNYEEADLVLHADFQIQDNGWSYPWNDVYGQEGSIITRTIDAQNSKVTFTIPVSTITALSDFIKNGTGTNLNFIPHMGIGSKVDLKPAAITGDYFTVGGINYSLQMSDDVWNCAALKLRSTESPDTDPTKVAKFDDVVSLENVNGVAHLVLEGTYSGFASTDDFKAYSYTSSFDRNGGKDGTNDWGSRGLSTTTPVSYEFPEEGKFKMKFALDHLEYASGATGAYTFKFGFATDILMDFRIDAEVSQTLVVGTTQYDLMSKPNSTAQEDFWGLVGVTLSDAPSE